MKKGLVWALALLSSIMLSSALGFTNICLWNNATIHFSQCNPEMDDYTCTATSCQLCVNEISAGIYCPASPQTCTNECTFYIFEPYDGFCQYKDYIEGNKSLSNLYVNGTKQTNILEIRNYVNGFNGNFGWAKFELFNNLDDPVNVRIEFLETATNGYVKTAVEIKEIKPHDLTEVYRTWGLLLTFHLDTIEFKYNSNNYTEARWEKELIEVCRQCAGQNCLNDGQVCNLSFQCGGGYCIEGICLNANDTLNFPLSFESNISSLESWKLTIEAWKLTITTALSSLWTAINGHATRIATLENKTFENKTLIINNTYIINNTLPNYFKYLSSSDRKKLVCGLAEEKHLSSLIDLGWNCTITYRQSRTGERADCRCKTSNSNKKS